MIKEIWLLASDNAVTLTAWAFVGHIRWIDILRKSVTRLTPLQYRGAGDLLFMMEICWLIGPVAWAPYLLSNKNN